MYCSLNSKNEIIVADDYSKDQGQVYCPSCHGDLVFRNGKIRVKHFAHKVINDCTYGEGETNEHLEVKQYLYRYFKDRGIEVHPECTNWKGIRPDVAVRLNEKWIGFEVQKSQISIEEIDDRMRKNKEHGLYNLWILPKNEYKKMSGLRFRMKEQNIYLKNLYYGWLYVYNDNEIHAIKCDNATTWVEEYEDYYTGETYGGYTKTLAKTFDKICDRKVDLLQDFVFKDKPEYASRYSYYPECKVYCMKYKLE